ncbi:MAG: IS1595 family transposase [Aliidongia sp.]
MVQHFLLSAAARTISLAAILRMSDAEAHATFVAVRWADNEGKPYCVHCGCLTVWTYAALQIWKCAVCARQFSVTSGTIFANRKLAIRDYLAAIALFCNGAKGVSALQLGRDLDVQYKTAFVLAHKLREAMGSTLDDGSHLAGTVEIDGAYFGGNQKPANKKADRIDRRLAENQTGKRLVVVVMRERNGRTLPFVCPRESAGAAIVRAKVAADAIVHADEASGWDVLHGSFDMRRVNHSKEFKATDGACTNQAESYFSRLRRAEIGTHHRISGKNLDCYANEMAWRENNRRTSTGAQWKATTTAALACPVSARWAGYWQRKAA